MYPHVIRLRKPWDVTLQSPGGGVAAIGLRHFNRPSGLSVGEAVWLVFRHAKLPLRAWLNDQPLTLVSTAESTYEVEITASIAASNQLRLEFLASTEDVELCVSVEKSKSDLPRRWLEEVTLEIRSADAD
jgi:hypothetical protein